MPEVDLEVAPPLAPVAEPEPDADAGVGAEPNVVLGAGTPDVSGLSDALEAPEKATA